MADSEERSRLIAEFSDVTGTDTERAQFFLESSGWQLHLALSSFFEDGDSSSPSHAAEPQHTSPQPEVGNVTRVSPRFVSMAGFRESEGQDNKEDEGQAFYAGGSETSGQQILGPPKKKQTPDDITQNIFEEAKRHGAEEIEDEPGPSRKPPQVFKGAGYRLGDTEGGTSQPLAGTVPVAPGQQAENMEVVLQFWSNGFSVDNGELRSFDDPQNEDFLAAVKRGEIPRELLRLSKGGEVHVNLEDHRNVEYVAQKRTLKAFTGEGHKLGSPTPAIKFNEERKRISSSSSSSSSSSASSSTSTAFSIDQSQPSTSIQIRLGDGTRMVAKFNHTHTVGDIRGFIVASRPQMAGRPFVLMTTFPNRELTDDGQSIQDANLLNAVIVQRFK